AKRRTSIERAATVHTAPSWRRPVARYGGRSCCSTASASGDRSASPCSTSTITSPSGSVANSTASPAIAGASTVTTASLSAGRAPLLQRGKRTEGALPVDAELGAFGGVCEIEGVALWGVRQREHLDPTRLHHPESLALSRAACAVRRPQLRLHSRRKRLERRL